MSPPLTWPGTVGEAAAFVFSSVQQGGVKLIQNRMQSEEGIQQMK
jgi:hypothetical protein